MKETARKSTSIVHGSGGAVISQGGVCRVCLEKCPNNRLLSLFLYWTPPWKSERSVDDCIAKQLVKLAGTQIKQSDGFPQQICFACFASFKEAYTFYYKVRHHDNVMRSNQLLVQNASMSMSELMGSWNKPVLYDSSDGDPSEEVTPYPIEVKQEVLSEEEAEWTGQPDMEIKQEADIKIEPEELVPQFHSSERMNGLTDINGPPTSSIVISSSFSMISHLAKRPRTTSSHPIVEQAETMVKEEVLDTESSEVDSDLPLDCMLCCREFHTIAGLKAHVISSHSYGAVMRKRAYIHNKAARLAKERDSARDRKNGKSKRNAKKRESTEENTSTAEQACVVCGKTFTTQESLSAHERTHRSKCEHCDLHFLSYVSLAHHAKECTGQSAQRRKTKTVQQLRREYVAEAVEEPIKRRKSSTSKYECCECNEKFDEKIYLDIHEEDHRRRSIADSGPKSEESAREFSESTEVVQVKMECDIDLSSDKVDGQNEALEKTGSSILLSILENGRSSDDKTTDSQNNYTDVNEKSADKKNPLGSPKDKTDTNEKSADENNPSCSPKKNTNVNEKSADEKNPLGSQKNKTDTNEKSADEKSCSPKKDTNVNEKPAGEKNPSCSPEKDRNVNEKSSDEKKTADYPTEKVIDDSAEKAQLESVEENPHTINFELSKEVTITLEPSDDEVSSCCPSTDTLDTVKFSIDSDQAGTELLKESERKDESNSEISEKTMELEEDKSVNINSDLKPNHESAKGVENMIVDSRESELDLKLAAFENTSELDLNTNIADIAKVALSDSDVLESGKRLGCEKF